MAKQKKAAPQRLTQEAIEAIQSDSVLYGKVADMLSLQPVSLPPYLTRNDRKLTFFPIVMEIAATMGVDPSDILETESDVAKAV